MMELEISDIDDITSCEECGVLFNTLKCKISEEKTEWYGTNIHTKCPVCKTIHIENFKFGYYK